MGEDAYDQGSLDVVDSVLQKVKGGNILEQLHELRKECVKKGADVEINSLALKMLGGEAKEEKGEGGKEER